MTTRGFMSMAGKNKKPPATKKATSSKRVAADKQALTQSWLKRALDDHREDKRPLWGRVKDGGWHPSSLGENCDRKSILGMFGYRGDLISQKLSRIFDMGKAVEKIWQEDFKKMGILLSSNVRLQDAGPPAINGEYDVMVRHPYEPERRLLGEIKSINCGGFKNLPPCTLDPEQNFQGIVNCQGYIGDRIRGYMVQFQSYLRLTGVEEGFILFDNKCTSDYVDYFLTYQPDFLDHRFDRLKRLDPYRERLVVPPCTCEAKHEGLCAYRPEDEVALEDMKRFSEDI